jgi:prepilin-type processing-associated H-X9-DG protein
MSNLNQMGIVFKMYSNEFDGLWPRQMHRWSLLVNQASDGWGESSPNTFELAPGHVECDHFNPWFASWDGPAVFPNYLNDVAITECPSDGNSWWSAVNCPECVSCFGIPSEGICPCRLASSSYFYLGWALTERMITWPGWTGGEGDAEWGNGLNEGATIAYWNKFDFGSAAPWNFGGMDSGFSFTADNGDRWSVPRLKEGAEVRGIRDINNAAKDAIGQSQVPVMWDKYKSYDFIEINHIPNGGNVLYFDGHVEFLVYPSHYPMHRYGPIGEHYPF